MLPLILAVVGGYFIGDSMKNKSVFAEGGVMDEGVDLFEDYKNIPPDVQEILDRHENAFIDGDYIGLGEALDDLENIGYTFDFYVDGGAYDLRQIGQRGKSEQESDEYYEGNYAKGGIMDAEEISRSNQEMVSSQVKAIKHHADELSNTVTDKTPIEAWVVAKVERSETDLSDVTHYLDGLKYGDGGMMAKGGKTKKGDVGKSGTQYGYTLKDWEDGVKKQGLLVSPSQWWKSQDGKKYKDFIGRTQKVGLHPGDEERAMQRYGYLIAIGMDLGSKIIPASAKKYVNENNYSKFSDGGMMDDDGDYYDIVIVYKESEEDGGKKHKERFYINAKGLYNAKAIARRMWDDKYEKTDLKVLEVLTDDAYRNKYIKF
jgi:hypothetical protein